MKSALKELWVYVRWLRYRLTTPRKMHVYCIGAARSGTHSIAQLLASSYKTSHEPGGAYDLINILRSQPFYAVTDPAYQQFFRHRDRELYLDLESSHLLGPFAETLHATFPKAQFIVTIRDCYSWLDSIMNSQINGQGTRKYPVWKSLYDMYFQAGKFTHAPHEQILAEYRLYTLDGYLAYWREHYQYVLAALPPEKRLVLRTCDLRESRLRLAEFLHIAPETLDMTRAHGGQALKKYHILHKLDQNFLEEKVALYCADLMQQFFPTICHVGDILK